jgi:phospholipase/carboxylesterase
MTRGYSLFPERRLKVQAPFRSIRKGKKEMTTASERDGKLKSGLPFVYRLHRGLPEGGTFILLHGSGVDETTLVPLAREVSSDATLIAVRGRVVQDDSRRWFTRITPTRFDQKSIREEAAAFAVFVREVAAVEGFDVEGAVFLGYSNGANLVSSVMLLHPGIVRRAALLRSMPVLDEVPPTRIDGSVVLVIAGARDETYGPYAPALAALLAEHGAEVQSFMAPSGHEFGSEDAKRIREWFGGPRRRRERFRA